MSRIAKTPIMVPDGVRVSERESTVTVTGPRGAVVRQLHPYISVVVDGNTVSMKREHTSRFASALWGTFASHLKNMIHGVVEGYEKKLVVEGIGYRAEKDSANLVLLVGFSHPVVTPIPDGIEVSVEKNIITVGGIDKECVGTFAARIRAIKKSEPYKGKGIHYAGEVVRRKAGKNK